MKRFVVPAVLLVLVLAVVACRLVSSPDNFSGDRVRNPERYWLSFQSMTQEDKGVLAVGDGDSLHCRWSIEKGSASVRISSEDGSVLYKGDDIDTADFLLPSLAAGSYTVAFKARRAQGTLEVSVVRP